LNMGTTSRFTPRVRLRTRVSSQIQADANK
jgi:hypothetical protein